MKNVYRFTQYRINHVRNRRSDLGGSMVSQQIDHLHNLRLQLDRTTQQTSKQIQEDAITTNQSQDTQAATTLEASYLPPSTT